MPSKGKRYGTRASAFQHVVQGNDPIRHPTTGDIIGHKKEIIVEAAVHGKELNVTAPDGSTVKVGDIHGHYIDTAVQAELKDWTEEERERVEAALDYWCEHQPAQIWHLEEPAAPLPWPTYEDMHHKQIAPHAIASGQAVEALAYERQRENPRREIIELLETHIASKQETEFDEQALTAA